MVVMDASLLLCCRRVAVSAVRLLLLLSLSVSVAEAGPREQAKRLHDRIAGVPPDSATLDSMAASITSNNANAAAQLALDNPAFYNVTLKNFVTPWTNEEQTLFEPLNDYTATVIGVVRDNLDFRRIMYDDILYVGKSSLGLPSYSNSNNNHYEAMESQGVDLKSGLVKTTQSSVTGLPAAATSGVITSRAAAKAFFIDGTNRAMFRFTLLNHLCNDLEQIKDVTRAPDRVRQDVSRSPGGDSRIFLNSCVGCHAGMDPMVQAYAYYDYEYNETTDPDAINGQLVYNSVGAVDAETGSRVQGKYLINAGNFKYGYVTTEDRWDNYWRHGPNALLGWDTSLSSSGSGAKSLGMELASSDAFASCQVKKVFKAVCFREPGNSADRNKVDAITASFKSSNYNLKQVFADTAIYCMGQ
jgi:hypothetical protein